jgi:hypothetical protein
MDMELFDRGLFKSCIRSNLSFSEEQVLQGIQIKNAVIDQTFARLCRNESVPWSQGTVWSSDH